VRGKIFAIGLVLISIFLGNPLLAMDVSTLQEIRDMICHPEPELVPFFMKQQKLDVNSKLEGNLSLLQLAIGTGAEVSFIEELILKGVDINSADRNGSTAFFIAAIAPVINPERYDYYLEIVKLLIQHQAEVNAQLKDLGTTALHLICGSKEAKQFGELILTLLKAGSNPNIQDNEFELTPLHCALRKTVSKDVVKFLLQFGADPNIKSASSYVIGSSNALHFAVWQRVSPSVIELLLQAKANPNQLNVHEMSPLNTVIARARQENTPEMVETAKLLIEYGADRAYVHPVYGSLKKIAQDILGKEHPITLLIQAK
jgi:ankyrin repeat protein